MMPMNDFIDKNLENSHFVLDKLATAHPDLPNERLPEMSEEEVALLANHLHISCALSKTKFLQLLREDQMDPEMIQEIGSVIVRLGPIPKKMTRPAPVAGPPMDAAAVNAAAAALQVDKSPKEDPAMEKKRQKIVERDRKAREREERKLREKEDKKKAQEAAAIAPPAGTILVASFLSLKQVSSLKTWKKRYYALYSNST